MLRYLLAALALVVPGAAHAGWLEASSANFVVYANDSEKEVQRFAERLELYHQAMEVLTGIDLPEPSPSNRVTVYVVRNMREVQKLYGGNARYVGGFYVPRAGSSVAFVPQVDSSGSGQLDFSMIALLHEYAHHFLISNSRASTPRWFGEGAAEFFASAEFPAGGGIKIGMPAQHRAGELAFAREVTVEQLLDPAAYDDGVRKGFDSFYGKSWALYHYLTLGPETRTGQLATYLRLIGQGKGSREAGLEAFGDFRQLDRDLDKYLRQSKLLAAVFTADKLHIGAIAVRPLTAGEAAVMPVRIRSDRGVTREEALELLVDARAVAAQYPGEAMVQSALAEAEFDAGNDAEAIAAADAALALDPKQANAYVQKGYALFRQAAEADDAGAAYKAAVAPFLALNKIEHDHPLPLVYYFRSFAERGEQPPEQAVRGLERATELAPFDVGLRFNLAVYQINAGDLAQARANLLPLAYNPHGGDMAEAARRVVERIDAGGEPAAPELLALLSPPSADEPAGGDTGGDAGSAGAD
jgi:Flp pilus assembly protein TadD